MFILFVLTLFIGFIGGYIGDKLRIPAGAMVMSMVFVGIFQIVSGQAFQYDCANTD